MHNGTNKKKAGIRRRCIASRCRSHTVTFIDVGVRPERGGEEQERISLKELIDTQLKDKKSCNEERGDRQ